MRGHWAGKNTDVRLSPEEKGGVRKCLKCWQGRKCLGEQSKKLFLSFFFQEIRLPAF